MGWLNWGQPKSVVHIEGDRGSVLVTGLGYKRKDLPRAFGKLSKVADHDFTAVLKPQSANQYNRTPIEVWVNDVHIGYINDNESARYWKLLRRADHLVSCDCVVKTGGRGEVLKVRLSLPSAP
jgi:hypothetical protein